MTDFVTAHEAAIRMSFFVGIFLAVALVELIVPRRALTTSKKSRWFGNIGIVFIDTFMLRLLAPAGAVGVSVWIGHQGWGLLNTVQWPFWVELVITVIVLDFVVYMQHLMFHAAPILSRLHMMHHADLDIDLTTGTRFHPL
ncbi:MAG: sterol desaturase family protein, partial [Deltaproteobacteria bacterium]|nr:sterol desaturase family protein [Deltaproteobacteria bacterium]